MPEETESAFNKILRSRVLIFITLLTIIIGVFFYHFVEHLSWLDAIYFTVITLATVGYGDIAPKTTVGKIFTVFYVITGIGVLVSFANAIFGGAVERRVKRLESRKKQ